MNRKLSAACVLVLTACGRGGCRDGDASHDPRTTATAALSDAQCRAELLHGAVAVVPGTGEVSWLTLTCDGRHAAVFAVRGEVLSRMERALDPAAPFATPEVLALHARVEGAIAEDAWFGPVAWHPAGPSWDEDEARAQARTIVVSAMRRDAAPGQRTTDTLVEADPAAGWFEPLFPLSSDEGRPFRVAGTLAGDAADRAVPVLAGSDGQITDRAATASMGAAIVRASAPSAGIVLARGWTSDHDTDGGSSSTLGVFDARRGLTLRASMQWPPSLALFVPRGVALSGGGAAFAAGALRVTGCETPGAVEFARGSCATFEEAALIVFRGASLKTVPIAAHAHVDAIAADSDGTVLALTMEPGPSQRGPAALPVQRLHRIDPVSGTVSTVEITARELPPYDHPSLARCGDTVWLAAEVQIEPDGPDGGSVSGALALPLACLTRPAPAARVYRPAP